MDQTQRLLQMLVENGRMGEEACAQLARRAEDAELMRELAQVRKYYAEAARDAEAQLVAQGIVPRPKGPMARMGLWMGMQINTAVDQSASHIAEIVIQGLTMGILELTKARNSNPDADAQSQGIASNLIARQQGSIEKMKTFLREKIVVK